MKISLQSYCINYLLLNNFYLCIDCRRYGKKIVSNNYNNNNNINNGIKKRPYNNHNNINDNTIDADYAYRASSSYNRQNNDDNDNQYNDNNNTYKKKNNNDIVNSYMTSIPMKAFVSLSSGDRSLLLHLLCDINLGEFVCFVLFNTLIYLFNSNHIHFYLFYS